MQRFSKLIQTLLLYAFLIKVCYAQITELYNRTNMYSNYDLKMDFDTFL
jgi:hypothetical protein